MVFVKEDVKADIKAIVSLVEGLEDLKTLANTGTISKTEGEHFFSILRESNPTLQKLRRRFKDADSAHYRIDNSLNSTIINFMDGHGKPIKDVVAEIDLTKKFLDNIVKQLIAIGNSKLP